MQNSFNSKELALLSEVVEKACVHIGGCDEPTKAMIASRAITLAERGQWDPALLLSALIGSRSTEAIHGG